MNKGGRLYKERQVLNMVWHAARGQHVKMTIALLLELVIGLFPPAAIYILQHAAGVNAGNLEAMFTQQNIIYALVIFFIYILLTKITRVMTAYAVAEVEFGLRTEFSKALIQMPYLQVTRTLGMQSSNGLTQEISMASALIPIVYKSFIRGGTTILAFCVLLTILSPRFFVIVIALIGVLILSIVILRKRLKRIHKSLYKEISSLHQLFADWISGYRVFRVYSSMNFAINRMQQVFQKIRDISRRLTLMSNTQSAFAEMLTYGMAAMIIMLMPSENGIVNISLLVSYPTAILFIRGELLGIINGYQQLATTESSITRLYDILFGKKDKNIDKGTNFDNAVSINFRDVDYSYEEGGETREILKNTNLVLSKGQFNVITGPSGQGKTTSLNLMLGLLQPDSGIIDIDYETGDRDIHSGVALVEQEPYLFDGSLYDNICMGRTGISESDIMSYIDILELSAIFPDRESIHESIKKFDTRLSTGEKQRLALIRALIGKPAVLIADEITSNIDYHTALLIIKNLKELSKEILIITVSHDKDVISAADNLYIMEDKHFTLKQQKG